MPCSPARRQWQMSLHFNKGLAGAPPSEIAAAQRYGHQSPGAGCVCARDLRGRRAPRISRHAGSRTGYAKARRASERINKAMDALLKVAPGAGFVRLGKRLFRTRLATLVLGHQLSEACRGETQIRSRRACSSSAMAWAAKRGAPTASRGSPPASPRDRARSPMGSPPLNSRRRRRRRGSRRRSSSNSGRRSFDRPAARLGPLMAPRGARQARRRSAGPPEPIIIERSRFPPISWPLAADPLARDQASWGARRARDDERMPRPGGRVE